MLELNVFQKKLENSLEMKILQRIFINTSISFSNVWIFLYWIYWFFAKGKRLLEYTNLFSPNEYKKNDKTTLKYFQYNLNKLKYIVMFTINIENLKNLKYYIFFEKSISIVYSKCGQDYKKNI